MDKYEIDINDFKLINQFSGEENDSKEIPSTDYVKVFRIIALREITLITGKRIKKGDKGGYIESYENLSQVGSCWVDDNAMVWGNARVRGYAIVRDYAKVKDNAEVGFCAEVRGHAIVTDYAEVRGRAIVKDYTIVRGHDIAWF